MGEYIGASIQLGGKLPNEHVDELINLINDRYGLQVNWSEGEATRDNLGSFFGRRNLGNLDEIENFAIQHNLHYLHWFDHGSEWGAAKRRYNPETGASIEVIVAENGEPALTRREIESLGSMEAIIEHFQKITMPLPPLEIV